MRLMDNSVESKSIGDHDWHSKQYVDDWISRDVTRDDERRPILRQMIEAAPYARDADIAVLDVGAGYGIVAEEVLIAFPRARVTLQDYSLPMLDHSRNRLARYADRLSFAVADFHDDDWPAKVGGPFELIVSGLAVHNLHTQAAITAAYRAINGLLKPGGIFLDYDLAIVRGGIDTHLDWMRGAGFEGVRCTWKDDKAPFAIMTAVGGATTK